MQLRSPSQMLQGETPLLQVSFSHSTKLLPILAAVQSIPLNSAATAFNQWIQGFCGHPQKLYVNLLCKERKARRSFPPASPTQKRKTSPLQCSSPGVMKAFFTNKDTVSSFGAGTIFCDCLGLVPALARGTGLGSANVSWDCSWGRGCPCTTAVWKARLQGTPAPGCCVARTTLWLWLKVVAGALWVSVAEAV